MDTMANDIDLINEAILSFMESVDLGEKVWLKNINESEYRWLMLNEEMHYPSFLKDMYHGIGDFVEEQVNSLDYTNKDIIERGMQFEISYPCEYFDSLWIELRPRFDGANIDNKTKHVSSYDTNCEFKAGKLINPKITINYPITRKGKTNSTAIWFQVAHELTHLYDDWVSRNGRYKKYSANDKNNINFHSSVCYTDGDDNVKSELKEKFGKLGYWLSCMLYLFYATERKAYIAQTVSELEQMGCNVSNRDRCIYRTSAYRNYKFTHENLTKYIIEADANTLSRLNELARLNKGTNLPYISVFNAEEYRKKLVDMSENIYHSFLRRYGGVVRYYFDYLIKENKVEKWMDGENKVFNKYFL